MKYIVSALSRLCHLWGTVLGIGALAVIPAINPPLWVVLMMTAMSVVMLTAERALIYMQINEAMEALAQAIQSYEEDEDSEDEA